MQKNILLPTGIAAFFALSGAAFAQQASEPSPQPPAPAAVVQVQPNVATPPNAAPVAPAQNPVIAPAQAPVATPSAVAPVEAAWGAQAQGGEVAQATPSAPASPTAPTGGAPAASETAAAEGAAPTPVTPPSTSGPSAAPVSPAVTPEAPALAPSVTPMNDTAQQTLPNAHDLTPMGMYNQADWVVKSVMIILAVACFLTWTIWLFKTIEIFIARSRARRAARLLTEASSLPEASAKLGGRRDPAAFMAQAVLAEYHRSAEVIDPVGAEGTKERAVSLVNRVEVQASARLRRGMGILATVGSVSPFVGLFGTVWGIMNSFIGIAETQTTNLAVVAPGIAEALFATAIGLVAAIPAVVIYNHFTRGIAAYRQALGDAGAATLRLLSRDIDFRNHRRA